MGKPLIGDGQMLAIHATMARLRESHSARVKPTAGAAQPDRQADVALLAATLLQLRPGDTLITGDQLTSQQTQLAAEVLSMAQEATFSPENTAAQLTVGDGAEALFAAGYAHAQMRATRAADDAPVTVALLAAEPRTSSTFAEAMRLASRYVLPLVLIVQDGLAASAHTLNSSENVEVVRVDAADAVACCRVMQESLLRARNRWGCVVLHAVHVPGATDAMVAFEAHLRRRGLQF